MGPNSPADDLFLALQAAIAGRYSLERELGRGGMGIVYLARDVALDRPVALKLLPPERARLPETRERFLREARMAARLAHPNIVPIHAVEEAGTFVFYAMRYVAGESLGERLRRDGVLSARDAAHIVRDTAYALAYAHAQGVIHRDIKPDNILLEADGERALVTDFGIARLRDDGHATGGRIVGTPEYVAPEQAAGETADGRSDLYSLGAVAFHCLAGRPPFTGDVPAILAQHLTQQAPPLRAVAPHAPRAYADAVDRALAKRPADRFETAEAMAEAIAPLPAVTAEMPVPVRIWVERGRELKGAYVIWSLFFYGIGTMVLVANLSGGSFSLPAMLFVAFCAANTALPWVGHGLWRISETRKAIEAGARLHDLRKGAALATIKREEELQYEASREVHSLARVVRYCTYLAFGIALFALFGGVYLSGTYETSAVIFAIFGMSTMATVGGALFGLIFPGRRVKPRDPWTRLRSWFWNGPLGDMMMRVSSIGLAPTRAAIFRAWRPTEMELGSATETLYDALPAHERAVLADLPHVVSRLEQEAASARQRLAAGEAGAWAARLEMSVAAIETLRLGLMRMTAGQAEAGSLTADLDAARELAERIGYLAAGAAEVADVLSPDAGTARQSSIQAVPRSSAPSTSLG